MIFWQSFNLATQYNGAAVATGSVNTKGSVIGNCVTDQMAISAPGANGSPVICGYNKGQHSKYTTYLHTM